MSYSPTAPVPVDQNAPVAAPAHREIVGRAAARLEALEARVVAALDEMKAHVHAEIEAVSADLGGVTEAVQADVERGFAWIRSHL